MNYKNLDELDKIIVDDKVRHKISEELRIADVVLPAFGVLNEGVIVYKNYLEDYVDEYHSDLFIYFKNIDNEYLQLASYRRSIHDLDKVGLFCSSDIHIKSESTKDRYRNIKSGEIFSTNYNDEDLIGFLQDIFGMYAGTTGYLFIKEKDIITTISQQQNKLNKKKKPIQPKYKHKIDIDGLKVYANTNLISDIKRTNEKHAESWSVRGHQRKLKSGKVIHVKPYIKGKGTKIEKEYVL